MKYVVIVWDNNNAEFVHHSTHADRDVAVSARDDWSEGESGQAYVVDLP